jgi:hypothetical protein
MNDAGEPTGEPIVLAPGAGRAYPIGRISAVCQAAPP